jgi:predicted aspartyl protease
MHFSSRLCVGLAALVGFGGSAPAAGANQSCDMAEERASAGVVGDALFDVPFRTIESRIYLDVMVNGEGPFIFALDTGASGIGRVDESLVAELGLPPAGEGETSDGITTARVDTVLINSLTLGGLTHADVAVIARDYRSRISDEAAFSGILGRGFFADGLLVIDFPAQRVRYFTDRELRPDLAGAMAYDRAFRVPVTLGTVATIANLDTGADVALLMPTAVYEQLPGDPLQPAGNISLTNTKVPSFSGRVDGPVRVGDAVLFDLPVRVASSFPEVLIGAQALKDQRVLIDQRHKTVTVCPVGMR